MRDAQIIRHIQASKSILGAVRQFDACKKISGHIKKAKRRIHACVKLLSYKRNVFFHPFSPLLTRKKRSAQVS